MQPGMEVVRGSHRGAHAHSAGRRPSPPTAAIISLLNTHTHTAAAAAGSIRSTATTTTPPASMARLAILVAMLLLAVAVTSSSPLLAAAQKASPKPAAKAAPGPAAAASSGKGGAAADAGPPTDVNKALDDDQFSEFKQLLHDTRVDTQINAQLTDSYNGLTIMAPTNAAFDKMKAGVLNGLSPQEQIQMVLYCVLPRFYSLSMLGTLDGKVNTQGSGHDGPYKYDIKRAGNNVNVSTGVNWMLLGSPVSKDFPLAIYPVDKVPLPYELFGPKPPTPAPAPAPAKSKTKKKKKAAAIAEPPTADDDTSTSDDQKAAAAAVVSVPAARWVVALSVLAAGFF